MNTKPANRILGSDRHPPRDRCERVRATPPCTADGPDVRALEGSRSAAFGRRRFTIAGPLLALAACAGLTGCLGFLKPAQQTARHFVLAPMPAGPPGAVPPGALALGVGQVKIPAYLFDTSLAVRQGSNEVRYLPATLWAERLDAGFQRVLAANLSLLLPTDRIRLSTWSRTDVAMEVHVTVEQFDLDSNGAGVLVARWRLVATGGEPTLKAGESRLTRAGPAPETDPAGAVATLSGLLADFSRPIAQAIRDASPASR